MKPALKLLLTLSAFPLVIIGFLCGLVYHSVSAGFSSFLPIAQKLYRPEEKTE